MKADTPQEKKRKALAALSTDQTGDADDDKEASMLDGSASSKKGSSAASGKEKTDKDLIMARKVEEKATAGRAKQARTWKRVAEEASIEAQTVLKSAIDIKINFSSPEDTNTYSMELAKVRVRVDALQAVLSSVPGAEEALKTYKQGLELRTGAASAEVQAHAAASPCHNIQHISLTSQLPGVADSLHKLAASDAVAYEHAKTKADLVLASLKELIASTKLQVKAANRQHGLGMREHVAIN
jgi:hypothetical protein